MQVGDERPHEPRLANTCRQRKTNRGKLALKIRDLGELGLDDGESGGNVWRLARRHKFRDAVKNLQGFTLRWPQAEASGNGVDVWVHGLRFFRFAEAGGYCFKIFSLPSHRNLKKMVGNLMKTCHTAGHE
jgi:hypothetical protein